MVDHTQFDPSSHPRANDGKFTEKMVEEASGGTSALERQHEAEKIDVLTVQAGTRIEYDFPGAPHTIRGRVAGAVGMSMLGNQGFRIEGCSCGEVHNISRHARVTVLPDTEPSTNHGRWVVSDEDPGISWFTTPDGRSATVYRETHDVPHSADYDLPHTRISYSWSVDDDNTGQVLAEGTERSQSNATRAALDALSEHLSPESRQELWSKCRCDRLGGNYGDLYSHATGCPLRGPGRGSR